MKAFPMPKPPSWEDAMGVAEQLRQGMGMSGPGQGDPLSTSPQLVGSVMEKMNEQYKTQAELHAGAWAGQLNAAHLHNSDLAMQERIAHDRAQEAASNRRMTDMEKSTGEKQQLNEDKFANTKGHQAEQMKMAQDKLEEAVKAHQDAVTEKEKEITARAVQAAQRNQLTALGIESNAAQNPNATPEDVQAVQNKARALQGSGGGTTAAGADKPPMEGAQKAPDGKWYIQKGDKYFRVGE